MLQAHIYLYLKKIKIEETLISFKLSCVFFFLMWISLWPIFFFKIAKITFPYRKKSHSKGKTALSFFSLRIFRYVILIHSQDEHRYFDSKFSKIFQQHVKKGLTNCLKLALKNSGPVSDLRDCNSLYLGLDFLGF